MSRRISNCPIRVVTSRAIEAAIKSSAEEDPLFALGYLNFWGPGTCNTAVDHLRDIGTQVKQLVKDFTKGSQKKLRLWS